MLLERLVKDTGPWVVNWGHAANASSFVNLELTGRNILGENWAYRQAS